MLHIIKVGSQIQIDDFDLLFNDCLCYPVDRFMCRSFRSISVRSCLEVRFEDRFQDELEGSLDHAITDGRNRENSDFSPVFGYFLLPYPHGSIRVVDQFVSDLLQTWTYSPQKRLVGSAFALSYRLLLRSCKLLGVFVISPLPPVLFEPLQTAGFPLSTGITPLHRYYEPLLLPLVFHHFPGVAGYMASLLRRFHVGTRRVSPVA